MNLRIYPRLAWDGIRKNSRFYTPYTITSAGMVMLFYIIHYLASMPQLERMYGGRTTAMMLGFGVYIVAIFSFIFLVYTNSFLMRRRKKEFGLYNILGMSKWNLSAVMFCESLIHFAISMTAGIFGGILLSKMAELGLTRALNGEITYAFTIDPDAIYDCFLIFVPIFGFIFVKNLVSVWRMSAVTLLKSENVGEKPPRANYLIAIVGIILLAFAYHIALSIENPLLAIAWFFGAVAMVIAATYLIFISGSVVLCRLLQKNKRYYYKKNHFVSVSSMSYRMRRNGAGLASICILSTMVLVMLLGSASLFFGTEDMINARYPSDFNLKFGYLDEIEKYVYTPEQAERAIAVARSYVTEQGYTPESECSEASLSTTGSFGDGKLILNRDVVEHITTQVMEHVTNIFFVSLADYQRYFDPTATLEADEVLLYTARQSYAGDTITLEDGTIWRIRARVGQMFSNGDAVAEIVPYAYIVVNDLGEVQRLINSILPEEWAANITVRYRFDLSIGKEAQIALKEGLEDCLREMELDGEKLCAFAYAECREEEHAEMQGLCAGIFFLGMFLTVVFLLATVLIIYYKQVTEGYEDERRYEILQKVGMTQADIQKSINSQVRTVFFLPLLTAIVHTCFAFPMVQKLLLLFGLYNVKLMWIVFTCTALVFGIIYTVIYRVTSNAYFAIVSGKMHSS